MSAGYGAVHASIAGALQGLTGTVTSTQAGNITMSTAGRALWEADNLSEDINAWDPTEFRNFVKWFIEVNHPEAVKQYQAVRAIERQAERAEQMQRDIEQAKVMEAYYRTQMSQAQNAYQYPTTAVQFPYSTTATQQEEPKKQGFWERCKQLAKRPLSHGDFY